MFTTVMPETSMAVTYTLLWWESTTTDLALRSSRTQVAVQYFGWYVASVM